MAFSCHFPSVSHQSLTKLFYPFSSSYPPLPVETVFLRIPSFNRFTSLKLGRRRFSHAATASISSSPTRENQGEAETASLGAITRHDFPILHQVCGCHLMLCASDFKLSQWKTFQLLFDMYCLFLLLFSIQRFLILQNHACYLLGLYIPVMFLFIYFF